MFQMLQNRDQSPVVHLLLKSVLWCLVWSLSLGQPMLSYAATFSVHHLPQPGMMMSRSPSVMPVLLKGLIIHPDQPLNFDFIVDSGSNRAAQPFIKDESERMVKYFLAALTVPADDLWVNLSPYEHDRMITEELGNTELGRDMLAQDYVLKQLAASMIYPEKELGQEFWSRVYAAAQQKFGTTDIPVDTFNKVWIMPDKAEIFDNGSAVYVTGARLKVMLDSDYLALENNLTPNQENSKSQATQILREVMIPALEQEVNEGENFSVMRQIYHAAILAKWYREAVQNTLLSRRYLDQKKVAGVEVDDKTVKEQIYARYIAAYKKGVFNYIKEEASSSVVEMLPRKYFSGGISKLGKISLDRAEKITGVPENQQYSVQVAVRPAQEDVTDAESDDGSGSRLIGDLFWGTFFVAVGAGILYSAYERYLQAQTWTPETWAVLAGTSVATPAFMWLIGELLGGGRSRNDKNTDASMNFWGKLSAMLPDGFMRQDAGFKRFGDPKELKAGVRPELFKALKTFNDDESRAFLRAFVAEKDFRDALLRGFSLGTWDLDLSPAMHQNLRGLVAKIYTGAQKNYFNGIPGVRGLKSHQTPGWKIREILTKEVFLNLVILELNNFVPGDKDAVRRMLFLIGIPDEYAERWLSRAAINWEEVRREVKASIERAEGKDAAEGGKFEDARMLATFSNREMLESMIMLLSPDLEKSAQGRKNLLLIGKGAVPFLEKMDRSFEGLSSPRVVRGRARIASVIAEIQKQDAAMMPEVLDILKLLQSHPVITVLTASAVGISGAFYYWRRYNITELIERIKDGDQEAYEAVVYGLGPRALKALELEIAFMYGDESSAEYIPSEQMSDVYESQGLRRILAAQEEIVSLQEKFPQAVFAGLSSYYQALSLVQDALRNKDKLLAMGVTALPALRSKLAELDEKLGGKYGMLNNPPWGRQQRNKERTALEEMRETIVDITGRIDKSVRSDNAAVGGIDIKNIDVSRRGDSASVSFSGQAIEAVMQGDFKGLSPVIMNVTPISSPLPLVGVGQVSGV